VAAAPRPLTRSAGGSANEATANSAAPLPVAETGQRKQRQKDGLANQREEVLSEKAALDAALAEVAAASGRGSSSLAAAGPAAILPTSSQQQPKQLGAARGEAAKSRNQLVKKARQRLSKLVVDFPWVENATADGTTMVSATGDAARHLKKVERLSRELVAALSAAPRAVRLSSPSQATIATAANGGAAATAVDGNGGGPAAPARAAAPGATATEFAPAPEDGARGDCGGGGDGSAADSDAIVASSAEELRKDAPAEKGGAAKRRKHKKTRPETVAAETAPSSTIGSTGTSAPAGGMSSAAAAAAAAAASSTAVNGRSVDAALCEMLKVAKAAQREGSLWILRVGGALPVLAAVAGATTTNIGTSAGLTTTASSLSSQLVAAAAANCQRVAAGDAMQRRRIALSCLALALQDADNRDCALASEVASAVVDSAATLGAQLARQSSQADGPQVVAAAAAAAPAHAAHGKRRSEGAAVAGLAKRVQNGARAGGYGGSDLQTAKATVAAPALPLLEPGAAAALVPALAALLLLFRHHPPGLNVGLKTASMSGTASSAAAAAAAVDGLSPRQRQQQELLKYALLRGVLRDACGLLGALHSRVEELLADAVAWKLVHQVFNLVDAIACAARGGGSAIKGGGGGGIGGGVAGGSGGGGAGSGGGAAGGDGKSRKSSGKSGRSRKGGSGGGKSAGAINAAIALPPQKQEPSAWRPCHSLAELSAGWTMQAPGAAEAVLRGVEEAAAVAVTVQMATALVLAEGGRHAATSATAVAGIGANAGGKAEARGPSERLLALASIAAHALNQLCRLDLPTVQRTLASAEVLPEFRNLCDRLLDQFAALVTGDGCHVAAAAAAVASSAGTDALFPPPSAPSPPSPFPAVAAAAAAGAASSAAGGVMATAAGAAGRALSVVSSTSAVRAGSAAVSAGSVAVSAIPAGAARVVGGSMGLEACFGELVTLLGYFAVGCRANQEVLQWGAAPTLLTRLCTLPFRYFSDQARRDVLFPTLVAACLGSDTNRAVAEQDVAPAFLADYVVAHRRAMRCHYEERQGQKREKEEEREENEG
ncbi:unnamed protein product, partial [Phaeothamnion confervicola]